MDLFQTMSGGDPRVAIIAYFASHESSRPPEHWLNEYVGLSVEMATGDQIAQATAAWRFMVAGHMSQILLETRDAFSASARPKPTTQQTASGLVVELPVPERDGEPEPAAVRDVASRIRFTTEKAPKKNRGGRPKGSKNKKKVPKNGRRKKRTVSQVMSDVPGYTRA